MAIVTFTKGDLMATTTVDPGWYSFIIDKVDGPKASKNGDSINFEVTFRLIDNQKYEGKEIRQTYNSKLIGKFSPVFTAALGIPVEPGQMNTDDLVGKKLDGKVENELYEGQLLSKIPNQFLPYKQGSNQQPF